MKYILKGNLRGFYCGDCSDPLNNVIVKIYGHPQAETATLLATSAEKETFHQRNEKELEQISNLLLASAETDEKGNFQVELSEKQYRGGAFDIDFECGTGPVRLPIPPKPKGPFQFHITTLQPQWRGGFAGDFFAEYQYEIPSRWFCKIYALFDLWVVCGTVTNCETKKPLEGLKVTAFDCDWIQDDNLGFDYTDAGGHFKIIYDGDKMRQTLLSPWLNHEYPAGPDYYFKIETSSGDVLLSENRNLGKRKDRANAGNCFCVHLCVNSGPADVPWFTRVGNFNITSDIDASGKTIAVRSGAGGVGFGFFHAIKLKGYAPEKFPGTTNVLFYRFQYSFDGVTWNNITQAQLYGSELIVGEREITWNGTTAFQDIVIDHSLPASVPDSIPADAAPLPMPKHVLHLDAQGWVRVDQQVLGSGFSGPLLWVDTRVLVPGGDANGTETPGANIVDPKNGRLVYVQFQTTDDLLDQTHYRTQLQQAKIYINNWEEVNLLRLEELHSGVAACTPITTQAHVKYSADHELMASWSVGIHSSATGSIVGLPSGVGPRGGISTLPQGLDLATAALTPPFNAIDWPSCSYSLTLTTVRSLTNGENNDTGKTRQVIFCR